MQHERSYWFRVSDSKRCRQQHRIRNDPSLFHVCYEHTYTCVWLIASRYNYDNRRHPDTRANFSEERSLHGKRGRGLDGGPARLAGPIFPSMITFPDRAPPNCIREHVALRQNTSAVPCRKFAKAVTKNALRLLAPNLRCETRKHRAPIPFPSDTDYRYCYQITFKRLIEQ